MKRDDVIALAVLGAVVLKRGGDPVQWGAGWWFPVPDVRMPDGHTYRSQVSHEFEAGHPGVDILYKRNGQWFAPVGTPITSARAGTVWSVTKSPRGWSIVIDHGKPFATFYQHLETPGVSKGQPVIAGQMLGTMGIDPLDKARVRHLHFAVWYKGAGDGASVDPMAVIDKWRRPPTWTKT